LCAGFAADEATTTPGSSRGIFIFGRHASQLLIERRLMLRARRMRRRPVLEGLALA